MKSFKKGAWLVIGLMGIRGEGTLRAMEGPLELPFPQEVSLEQKIGSMIMVGFQGASPDDEEVRQLKDHIDRGKVGGVILYDYNVENPFKLEKLIKYLKEKEPNLLVAVEQEGGKVVQLTPQKGFHVFMDAPGEMTRKLDFLGVDLQEAHGPVKEAYGKTARVLRGVGININLGGVADMDPVRRNLERSYGADPEKIKLYNGAAIDAHRENKVFYAIKHYPGYGYVYHHNHNHEGLRDKTGLGIPVEKEIFWDIAEIYNPSMIMAAHVMDRNIDEENPATLSKAHLSPLRDKFQGVIVSSDLMMGPILAKYVSEENEKPLKWNPQKIFPILKDVMCKAVKAGCDLLIFSNNPRAAFNIQGFEPDRDLGAKVHDALLQLVREGNLSLEKIEASWKRLQNLFSEDTEKGGSFS